MFRNPLEEQEKHAYGNLETIRDAFEFDATDGIYKPKIFLKQQKRKRLKRFWKQFRNHWATTLISAGTLILLIKTVHYARLQWIETEGAAMAAEEAARAAQSSAETAAAELKTSQQQFRMENRPYVWAIPDIGPSIRTNIKQLWLYENGTYQIAWVVHIKNGGRSPARDEISTSSETHIVDKAKFAQEVRGFIPHYAVGPGSIIAPDTSATVVTVPSPLISEDEHKLIEHGDRIVYVIGAVKYRDVFDPPRPEFYETRYCFVYLPIGMPVGTCGDGNSMK